MIIVTLIAILVCRIFSVGIPILVIYLWNGCKPLQLWWNEWIFVYLGGLIRGAIAFALSLSITTDHSKVLKTTTQICALITIVGIGSPIQLLARIFNIKPDKEVAEDKRKARLAKSAEDVAHGDDDFVKADAAEGSENAGSEIDFANCENEQDALTLIDKSFDDLIKENTYPWLITKFKNFDKNYMMPIFKRKTDLSGSSIGKSGYSDRKFGASAMGGSSAFNWI